jgi:hypothetical protein
MALVLERNGYKNYYDNNRYQHNNKIVSRCICGYLKTGDEPNICKCTTFKQARYILFSGTTDSNMMKVIQKISSPENKDGELIKVILGSQVVGEGIDFKNIRNVHIMESWYNMARLDQVIGRSVRTCSHIELPLEKRGVRVLMYCSTVPPTIRQDRTVETIDEAMYRYSEQKDKNIKRIEMLLIRLSVDCVLNTEFNIRDHKNLKKYLPDEITQKYKTKDGSRECTYSKCQYDCNINNKYLGSNNSTYTIESSIIKLQKLEKNIVRLFKTNFVLTQKQVEMINPSYSSDTIKYVIERIINNKRFVLDAYGRKGKIIKIQTYRDPYAYYIFQPQSITDKRVPLKYRMIPIMKRPKTINIDKSLDKQNLLKPNVVNSNRYQINIHEYLFQIKNSLTTTLKILKSKKEIDIDDYIPHNRSEPNRDKAIYQMKFDRVIYNSNINIDIVLNEARIYKQNTSYTEIYNKEEIQIMDYLAEHFKTVKTTVSDIIKNRTTKGMVLTISHEDKTNVKPYGIADYDNYGNFVFKLLLPGDKPRGQKCVTLGQEPFLNKAYNSLNLGDMYKNIQLKFGEDITLIKDNICYLIEYKLRELNITNKDKERRFINIYENNIIEPKK